MSLVSNTGVFMKIFLKMTNMRLWEFAADMNLDGFATISDIKSLLEK
jgi:hypothetical protein